MLCGCRARPSGSIRARCRNVSAARIDHFSCDRIYRHPDSYRIQSSGGSVRHNITFVKYHCKRPRPVFFSNLYSLFRDFGNNFFQCFHIRDMNDQRVVRRSSFCGIYLLGRIFIQCICSQTIYGLCGKCNQTSFF